MRAIGETGLDYYRDTARPDDQRRAFAAQIEIAVELDLPIVIHARDPEGGSEAVDEIFATLDARAAGQPVILHCFSAPWRVDDAAERGWYCSFAGNVTYPRSEALREAAAKVPEDRILVETDAPYLTPQPMRGKPQRAGQRRRHRPRSSPRCAASPTRSWSARSRPTPARSSAGSRPLVRLGQNFLADPNLLDAIVRDAEARRRRTWCSRSGPGKGC